MNGTRGEAAALGREKISKLLRQYAVPSVIGMLVSSLYNLVDAIFIGKGVGPDALSAIALTIPIMSLGVAFSLLIGVGSAAQMSIHLGRGDTQTGRLILGNMVVMCALIGALFSVASLVFLDEILLLLEANPATTLGYAHDFAEVILIGNIFTSLYMGLNALMRSTGYPQRSMIIMLATIVVNCLLGALFIFVFNWGVRGAALATVVAQVAALGFELRHYFDRSRTIRFTRGIFRPQWRIVRNVMSIGLSPFILNVCGSVVVIFINHALLVHGGEDYVGAFGIVNRYLFVFSMTVIGINQGVQPIIGYNFGAGDTFRLARALRQGILWATLVAALGGVAAQVFPRYIAMLFTNSSAQVDAAIEAFRYGLLLFPLVGFQMLSSSFFQSIGQAQRSIVLSVTRQVVFLIPLLIVLPHFWGVDGVWIALPVADGFSIILAVALVAGQLRRMGIKGLFRREIRIVGPQ
ncbi:MAG: MATE family efflux transporter [Rikenellaceae bacterium]|jgi:putative MATE family efflux protein|nr:MATE family efflux transporter [Rikenellaceae bacterium]